MRVSQQGAADQARLLDHGWIGPGHFLLAVLAKPNVASETLSGLGVTYERLLERVRSRTPDPDLPPPPTAKHWTKLNPAAHRLAGWAGGFAAGAGPGAPRPEHWLLALLYAGAWGDMELHSLGVGAKAVVAALATRGVRVPDHPPVEHRQWRGVHNVYVAEEERRPIVRVLLDRHPPGSEWRRGFNLVGEPRRCRISAEEGIDLDAIVAEVREQDA
jgi:hypothetical protein